MLQGAISPASCSVGMCLGDLQHALTRSDLLLLDLAGSQCEVVRLQGTDVLACSWFACFTGNISTRDTAGRSMRLL